MHRHNPGQLELALGGPSYVAVTATGDSIGHFMLPLDTPFFPQPDAADDPLAHYRNDRNNSCVGRVHY